MGWQRILVPLTVASCVMSWSAAWAQPPPPPRSISAGDSPGAWRGDRFFGFVPAHVKHETLVPAWGTNSDKTGTEAFRSSNASVVALASAEEHAPNGFVVPDDYGDFLVDPSLCPPCVETVALPKVWLRAEYLLWWTKGMGAPPLVTTSPSGTGQSEAGVLGQPGTMILFGDSELNDDARSGGRITLGMWLDPCETQGLDITYLGLEVEEEAFFASDRDFSILARPFFNVQTDQQDARLIVFPNTVEGSVGVHASTELQAAEVMVRRIVSRSGCSDLAYVLGYRYAKLADQLRVSDSTRSLSGPTAGSTFDLFDDFSTKNRFHGGELGLKYRWQQSGWSLDLAARVALGSTRSQAVVSGQTTTTSAGGGVVVTNAGLLAQATNNGVHERDTFSTVSEFGATLRRELNHCFAVTIGYDLLYWSEVLRAGEQVDFGVNPSQIPPGSLVGEPRPLFPFFESDFWAQGLHFGLEYKF